MKIHLLLLALALLSLPVRGDVSIYAGSATEQRPGVKHRTSRAYLVVENPNLNSFSHQPRVAVLLGGSNARHIFIQTYDEAQINDDNGFKFTHLLASVIDLRKLETRLDLVGNYTKDAALILQPRKFSGRLTQTQFPTAVVYILVPGDPQPTPQPADFSDIALSFSLDQHLTNTANTASSTFDNVVLDLKGRLASRP